MIKIAVVDDEKIVCENMTKLLYSYFADQKISVQIKTFCSGESLIYDIDDGLSYDLIFLDIELAKINGVEVGVQIRGKYNDHNCQIVYISSKTKYAMELFKIRPFNFLVKPIDQNNLYPCLSEYLKFFSKETFFEFKNQKIIKLIPVNSIVYFESAGRKIIIHCTDDEYSYYGQLTEIAKKDLLKNFIMIHKSFFVNIFHIESYSYEVLQVRIANKCVTLPISRPNRKEVRRVILEYNADKFN